MLRLIPGDPATVMAGSLRTRAPVTAEMDPRVIAMLQITFASMLERALPGVEVLLLADARRAN